MTTEDNYNAPNRSIADWIAEGYTKPYATALFAQANKRMGYTDKRLPLYRPSTRSTR